MKRKKYMFLFGVLLLSLTSLSPGLNQTPSDYTKEQRRPALYPLPSSQRNPDDHLPIRIMVNLNSYEFEELLKYNNDYMKETGNLVEMTNVPNADAYHIFNSSLAVGEAPDIMVMNSTWVRSFATQGYLLPVESYQSTASGREAVRALLQPLTWNGYQWGTPMDMDPYVLSWHTDSLKAMGIEDLPQGSKAWKELLAKQETRKDKKLIAMNTEDAFALAALTVAMDGNPLHLSEEDMDLLTKARPAFDFSPKGSMNDLTSGTVGNIPLEVLPISKAVTLDGVYRDRSKELQMPESYYASNPFLLRSRSFAVTAQSTHPKRAAEWVAYMNDPALQLKWFKHTGKLPALTANYLGDVVNDTQEIPVRLNELLHSGVDIDIKVDNEIQGKWDLYNKAAKLWLSGINTAQQYKQMVEAVQKEKDKSIK
ncbi:extracellular solute-binding protein [Paenibacillus pini]|uniref:Uncharacterized protein n=1 Tax=Paenibacillus pini JCM 16418 TaxID=1236976 RepID=W7YR68_9BACL|nr:extracellular solute-binding protein [Paenibacillus pini]GAF07066.1 hypothetical protein JCM16418_1054 [Paenibacillus pini JCM 16418]